MRYPPEQLLLGGFFIGTPWSIEEGSACFIVRDGGKQACPMSISKRSRGNGCSVSGTKLIDAFVIEKGKPLASLAP